jgi:cation:H+ antiporter
MVCRINWQAVKSSIYPDLAKTHSVPAQLRSDAMGENGSMSAAMLIAGLALLLVGGEWLVRGASRLAIAAGVSPLVVGLTVVAFSTSAPELAVNLQSALSGTPDLAIGNVVGSNISNILLILGLSAVIAPLAVQQQLIRLDAPIMAGASVALFVMALDGGISRAEGLLLFACILAYSALAIVVSRREPRAIQQEYAEQYGSPPRMRAMPWWAALLLVIAGVGALVIGGRWVVNGAVEVGKWLGLSDLVIGLTIVAIGTSLPELVTSIIATRKGERDIAVGNLIGSNIFNIFSVLGLTASIAPAGVPISATALSLDIPIMVGVALLCLPIFINGSRVFRWEGALFVLLYVVYLIYIVLDALQLPERRMFGIFGLGSGIVVAITILTATAIHMTRRTVRPR